MPSPRRLRFALCSAPALLGLLFLTACSPRTPDTDSPTQPSPTPAAPQPGPSAPSATRPEKLLGPTFTLLDATGRPLECTILAKQGDEVFVQRNSDQQRFVLAIAQLSPGTRNLLASYPDANTRELRTFVDERDYAAAKRTVKVEMISTVGSHECTSARDFFSAEGIPCQIYDVHSMPGKQRQKEWESTILPTVKIGTRVIRGLHTASYRDTLLAEYRKTLAANAAP